MSRQTTLSDDAQRTLTECADATERADTPTTERGLLDRVQAQLISRNDDPIPSYF
jgi:SprT-like protein